PGPLAQFLDRAELDRRRRARLGAGRDQAVALPVVAERTLVRMAVEAGAGDDAEGAGGDAVRAAVAHVGLDVAVLELVVEERARGAGLLAGGGDAVLADVAHHEPAVFLRRAGPEVQRDPRAGLLAVGSWPWLELFDELHVPPGRSRQLPGVVVAVAGP